MKYISRIFSTGAVRETPEKIIKKILSEIDNPNSANIIEFGAGKGEITQPVFKHIAGKTKATYHAFEIDKNFSALLKASLPAINVISEDAFEFEKSLSDDFKADYIISSMPLSFYSKPELIRFLQNVQERLNDTGKIIILFHAFWMIPFFRKQLRPIRIHRFNTLPPYFLLVFTKKSKVK